MKATLLHPSSTADARDSFGCGLVGEFVEAARFGDVPILAELAGQVATRCAERQDAAAGIEMIERFFLDGIDTEAGTAPVGGEHHRIIDATAHEARTALPFVQLAVARAQVALDATVVQLVPIPGRILFGDADRFVHISLLRAISARCNATTECRLTRNLPAARPCSSNVR